MIELKSTDEIGRMAVAGQFVRDEMARLGAVLVLKTGDVASVVSALRHTPAPR